MNVLALDAKAARTGSDTIGITEATAAYNGKTLTGTAGVDNDFELLEVDIANQDDFRIEVQEVDGVKTGTVVDGNGAVIGTVSEENGRLKITYTDDSDTTL